MHRLLAGWQPIIQTEVENAYKNHFSMHRVQKPKLRYQERQKAASGQDGDQEVLQILQKAYLTQGNEITVDHEEV